MAEFFNIPKGKTVALVGRSGSRQVRCRLWTWRRLWLYWTGWSRYSWLRIEICVSTLLWFLKMCICLTIRRWLTTSLTQQKNSIHAEQIEHAASKLARATGFIEGMESNDALLILSWVKTVRACPGGQRQRIAIRTALLGRHSSSVNDEATSA